MTSPQILRKKNKLFAKQIWGRYLIICPWQIKMKQIIGDDNEMHFVVAKSTGLFKFSKNWTTRCFKCILRLALEFFRKNFESSRFLSAYEKLESSSVFSLVLSSLFLSLSTFCGGATRRFVTSSALAIASPIAKGHYHF